MGVVCVKVLYMYIQNVHFFNEKEERKKQGQTRQSNTAHPRKSHFLRKMSCLGWDSNPQHTDRALYH